MTGKELQEHGLTWEQFERYLPKLRQAPWKVNETTSGTVVTRTYRPSFPVTIAVAVCTFAIAIGRDLIVSAILKIIGL